MAETPEASLLRDLARQIVREDRRRAAADLRAVRAAVRARQPQPPSRAYNRAIPPSSYRGHQRGSPYDKAVREYAREQGLTYQQARKEPGFKSDYAKQSKRAEYALKVARRQGWEITYYRALEGYANHTHKSLSASRSDPEFQRLYKILRDIEGYKAQVERQGKDWRVEMDKLGLRKPGGLYDSTLVGLGLREPGAGWMPGDTPGFIKRRS